MQTPNGKQLMAWVSYSFYISGIVWHNKTTSVQIMMLDKLMPYRSGPIPIFKTIILRHPCVQTCGQIEVESEPFFTLWWQTGVVNYKLWYREFSVRWPWDVSVLSRWCLGDVSVMSRSCLGRVSVLSRSCLCLVLVMSLCCFGVVSVLSRWRLGDVSVMSRSCPWVSFSTKFSFHLNLRKLQNLVLLSTKCLTKLNLQNACLFNENACFFHSCISARLGNFMIFCNTFLISDSQFLKHVEFLKSQVNGYNR